jgi:hypothetical protein
MANLNNLESPAPLSTTNTQIIGAGYTLPSGFNNLRQPGELSVLYAQNSDAIYNKYKLETNNSGLLRFGPKQPFITVNPNNARKGVNGLKRYESRALPVGSALQDVVRISKFSVSGNGIIFLGKQLILQGLNSFNETKLYNPLMPILASTSIASFGLITPPTRHIEPNLGGVLGALGLGAVSNALGLNKPTPPKGTVGAGALPKNATDGGKGLIRGSTASQANKNFQSKWQGGSTNKFGLSAIGDFFKANTLFGAFSVVKQPNGEKYKVGESTYGIMLDNKSIFRDIDVNGYESPGISQRWWGSTDGTAKNTPTAYIRYAPFIGLNGTLAGINFWNNIGNINDKPFGIPNHSDKNPRGSRYSENVGFGRIMKGGEDGMDLTTLEFSDQIVNYAYYIGTLNKNLISPTYFGWGTKHSDKTDPVVEDLINNNLKKLIENLKKEDINAKNEKYTLNPDPGSGYAYTPIRQYNWESSAIGYDYIDKTVKSDKYFSAKRFKNLKTLDPVPNANGENKNIGLSGPQRSDKINVLKVLSKDNFEKEYSKEDSDLIKFYFHDLVNDKYIPFRATVTGLNENLNADWTAFEYIGRADKLQSYKGFSRTLSFKFNVVANSIKELLPMWQRINYLVGLTKPANYTSGDQNSPSNIYSKFIIPPLVKFTIGDIYKNQPGVIKSIGMNIPDNCVWETLSEEYAEKNDWSYLNGVIQWNDSKGKYAQFPRECELNLSMDLLEKERPIVGGNNFGDSVRKLNTQGDYINPNNSDSFSRKILVVDEQSTNNQVPT